MRFRFERFIRRALPALMICGAGMCLTSCFDDEETTEEKYKDWREQNEKYVEEAMLKTENGKPYYTKIVPSWAPNAFVLMHWHNDRSLTAGNLTPMDNSTTQIKYELYNVEGKLLSDSYSNTDSLYTSRPSQNIVGMWTALTNMNVGDSVTIVMPAQSSYGMVANGDILPYSALIYNVKLKAVTAYEIP